MTDQEIATCCRISFWLLAGAIGPKFAALNVDAIFVRDEAFLLSLGRELRLSASELYAANRAADAENVAKRRLRSEALVVADDVLGLCAHLARNYPQRWQWFRKMIDKQTLRQIVRRRGAVESAVIGDGISWCSEYVRSRVDESRLDVLLTLRAAMA